MRDERNGGLGLHSNPRGLGAMGGYEMRLFAALDELEHGYTYEDACRRIGEWWERGYCFWSEIETRSTKLRRIGEDRT